MLDIKIQVLNFICLYIVGLYSSKTYRDIIHHFGGGVLGVGGKSIIEFFE